MFHLPPLPYAYDALRPVISETALRLHHGKHHAKYIEVTNALLAQGNQNFNSLEEVVESAARPGNAKLLDNAGQALNHAFFWSCMSPTSTGPSNALRNAVNRSFGNLGGLKEAFIREGAAHFGSGWVWLTARADEVSVVSTHDGGTMLARHATPLLVCDLWEHAYYLDFQNERAGFLSAWWDSLIHWDFVSTQFEAAVEGGARWRFAQSAALDDAQA